jgi:hypothetical protein
LSAPAADGASRPDKARPAIPFGMWWLTRRLLRHPRFFIRLGNFETGLFEEQLAGIKIDRPVFICGLARAGTTITLELLTSLAGIASYRYRDFPAVHWPLAWNKALGSGKGTELAAVERLHGDGIAITSESPEALDEPIWMSFFPDAHDPMRDNALGSETRHPEFERFYRQNLAKILFLRQGNRLVLKGNYLLSRLGYLVRLFPDARFVLLVRDPVEHIGSLMRQQANFSQAAGDDPRVIDYLAALGHFEFGLDRRPINLGDRATIEGVLDAWKAGHEPEGWALYWRHVYGWLAELLDENAAVRKAALVMRFEDLHGKPGESLDRILDHCGLDADTATRETLAARLRRPASHKAKLGNEASAQIRSLCGKTAAKFGYSS